MTGPHRHPHRPIGAPVTLDFLRERTTLDTQTGCWLWTGAIVWNGYGRVRVGKSVRSAHRVAYMAATGLDLPANIDVCHRCDVRACINPEHLFHGTRTDNMRDCANKGRLRSAGLAGDDCPASKLTSEEVVSIRLDPRSSRALATIYGVTPSAIKYIRSGKTWKSAAGPVGPRAALNQAGPIRVWTKAEDEAIRGRAHEGAVALAADLHRTPQAVRNRAGILRVRLPRIYRRAAA